MSSEELPGAAFILPSRRFNRSAAAVAMACSPAEKAEGVVVVGARMGEGALALPPLVVAVAVAASSPPPAALVAVVVVEDTTAPSFSRKALLLLLTSSAVDMVGAVAFSLRAAALTSAPLEKVVLPLPDLEGEEGVDLMVVVGGAEEEEGGAREGGMMANGLEVEAVLPNFNPGMRGAATPSEDPLEVGVEEVVLTRRPRVAAEGTSGWMRAEAEESLLAAPATRAAAAAAAAAAGVSVGLLTLTTFAATGINPPPPTAPPLPFPPTKALPSNVKPPMEGAAAPAEPPRGG